MELLLTGDGVLVAVALADANQEGAIFVLGGQQQLLSLQPVDVAVVPPAAGQARRLLEQQHVTTTRATGTTHPVLMLFPHRYLAVTEFPPALAQRK